MLVKVCGLKHPEQIEALDSFVDFVGFIFYRGSARYVTHFPATKHAKRVGVFVHAEIDEILQKVQEHSLNFVQLHGEESPEICAELSKVTGVIKAFGIHPDFNFEEVEKYVDHVDYFLFDTKTINHGGSGNSFDWTVLQRYQRSVPFFLSGGISPSSTEKLTAFNHPAFVGIDLNSGFELAPANKNIPLIQSFLHDVNTH